MSKSCITWPSLHGAETVRSSVLSAKTNVAHSLSLQSPEAEAARNVRVAILIKDSGINVGGSCNDLCFEAW